MMELLAFNALDTKMERGSKLDYLNAKSLEQVSH